MPRHISSRKEELENIAIMIAVSCWQGTKETKQKCFAKVEFKRTQTIQPETMAYNEDDSEEINDAWRKLLREQYCGKRVLP